MAEDWEDASWICPACGGEAGTLHIYNVSTEVEVYADGAEVCGSLDWEDTNPAACTCGWEGTAGDAAKAAEAAQ